MTALDDFNRLEECCLVTHSQLMTPEDLIKIKINRKVYIVESSIKKAVIKKMIDQEIFVIFEHHFNYKLLEEYIIKKFHKEKMYKKFKIEESKLLTMKNKFIASVKEKRSHYYQELLKQQKKEELLQLLPFNDKKVIRFKKQSMTVWDNPEFACEFAYVLAKEKDVRILLIDGDRLNPTFDHFFNVDKYKNKLYNHMGKISDSGFNIVLNAIKKEILTKDIFKKSTIQYLDNLDLLMGNYDLNNYEYYNKEDLIDLMNYAHDYYDVVITNVNKHIYDLLTCINFIQSDLILIPLKPSLHQFREFKQYIRYLHKKQNIPQEKFKFIAYEYDSSVDLEVDLIKDICDQRYIGKIKRNKERIKYRNLKDVYLKKINLLNKREYKKIISSLEIW
jgi:cellulose biosynthesis protein BcsQ